VLKIHCCGLLLFQERRREYSLKSPGIKPQSSLSARHNIVSSQQSISSVHNGSLFGSASTLSSRRHVPSHLNAVDDEMDVDSLSSGMSTPMTTTPTTTDGEFNMDDDSSSVFNATSTNSSSGFTSSQSCLLFLLLLCRHHGAYQFVCGR